MGLASAVFSLARPLLQRIDAEDAHRLALAGLRLMPQGQPPRPDPLLAVSAFGLDFPNPLGLAAGFDKNGEVTGQMLGMGFGFVEVGTVTPLAQAGNVRPRLFRLAEDGAVINRMGFNNEGHAALRRRLEARAGRAGIVGINLGANKDSADRIGDYVAGIATFSDLASYFTVNISSPNTPNLRALQSRAELTALLTRLNEARAQAGRRPPMLLKIAPDLDDGELRDIASACANGAVDGIVVSNTTLSRQGLRSPLGREGGGLSGRPLAALATRQIAKLHVMTEGRITLVGVGGIHDAASALARIRAGASLLQLYTALVFDGPGLVAEILGGLRDHLAASGQSLQSLRGLDAYQGLSGT